MVSCFSKIKKGLGGPVQLRMLLLVVLINFFTSGIEAAKQDKLYKPDGERVLVFAPHPGDDIMGCGGTLIKHIKSGSPVTIVYMTSGEAVASEAAENAHELAKNRESEARDAAKRIGITDIIFLRESDGKLERSHRSIEKVRNIISKTRPEIIYMPHSLDDHKDRKTTFSIVSAALQDKKKMPLVLCYEIWIPLAKITHKVDISSVIELKLKALAKHASQIPLNIVDAASSLNRYRGIMESCGAYGECFQKWPK